MNPTIRRSIAVLAGVGFAASLSSYVASYFGLTTESLSRWMIVVGIGPFILVLPMQWTNRAAMNGHRFFWKEYSRGMPTWVVPTITLLGAFFAIHFVQFLIESHAASPQIKDGQYVLASHAQILKAVSPTEYRHLKADELRLFATGWMFFYFVPSAYWWFPRAAAQSRTDA